MEYIELKCSLAEGEAAFAEVIMAQLGELGFESFSETEDGLLAYIPAASFDPSVLNNEELWPEGVHVEYTWQTIADQNWNAVWESNFEPVTLAGRCHIRAPFHPEKPDMEYEIVIEPKMSFGTAHHETTALMIEHLLETNVENLAVLDMGCGTGVLAILASMRHAASVTAIDNDEWAYNNSIENVEKNKSANISVYLGDAAMLNEMQFDLIIANINRNILLADIVHYRHCLKKNGVLLMSGFYDDDLPVITAEAALHGLSYKGHKERNKWVAARFDVVE